MSDNDLFRLVYASQNAIVGDTARLDAEIGTILNASRRNNVKIGVTGALLFSSDCFAQVLEGPCDAVQEVFERIQLDDRHRRTVVLEAKHVSEREFADWSMAYAGRVEDERASFSRLTGDDAEAQGAAGASEVLALLRGVVGRAAPALS